MILNGTENTICKQIDKEESKLNKIGKEFQLVKSLLHMTEFQSVSMMKCVFLYID